MARTVGQRLHDIQDAINHIDEFTAGKSYADFEADRKLQLAVERALEIISEASRYIPDSSKARYPVPWPAVASIGNVLRHAYHTIDERRIWLTATEDLAELARAVKALLQEAPT